MEETTQETQNQRDGWFPLFDFVTWTYKSFLIDLENDNSSDGIPVPVRKWAQGDLAVGMAFGGPDEYSFHCPLIFSQGVTLQVAATGKCPAGDLPGTFKATGTGVDGPTKGAIYELNGWIFPTLPMRNNASRPRFIKGSVRSVRGPDSNPEVELGGMPAGTTVGTFIVVPTGTF